MCVIYWRYCMLLNFSKEILLHSVSSMYAWLLVSKNSKHYNSMCLQRCWAKAEANNTTTPRATLFSGIQLDNIFNDNPFFTVGSSSRETMGMFCTQVRLYHDPYIPTRERDFFCIGDFRLTLEEAKRLRPLHCGGRFIHKKYCVILTAILLSIYLVYWRSQHYMWTPPSAIPLPLKYHHGYA